MKYLCLEWQLQDFPSSFSVQKKTVYIYTYSLKNMIQLYVSMIHIDDVKMSLPQDLQYVPNRDETTETPHRQFVGWDFDFKKIRCCPPNLSDEKMPKARSLQAKLLFRSLVLILLDWINVLLEQW